MATILSRSPYFIRIENASAFTGKLELYVYTGTYSSTWTSNVTYTLTASSRPSGSTNEVIFEVGELIKDKIELVAQDNANGTTGFFMNIEELAESLAVAVDWRTYYDTGSGFTTDTTSLGNTAVLGWSKYSEGSNLSIDVDDKYWWQRNPYIIKPFDAPILVSGWTRPDINAITDESDKILSLSAITPTQPQEFVYSGFFGEYDEIGGSNTQGLSYDEANHVNELLNPWNGTTPEFRYFPNNKRSDALKHQFRFRNAFDRIQFTNESNPNEYYGTTIQVENIYDCEYKPYRLLFINKFGALQELWMFKNSVLDLKVTEKTFKRNIVSYRTSSFVSEYYRPQEAQQTIYDKDGSQTITLNSGYYPESFNLAFEDLFMSEYVWLNYENATLPVVLTDKAFRYRNSKTDGLINHTLVFAFANDYNNNVR